MPVNLKKIRKITKHYKKEKNENTALSIIDDGDDVVFNIGGSKLGVWKGTRTSVMAKDHDGRKVLRWMLDKDFDSDALEIIQSQLDGVYL